MKEVSQTVFETEWFNVERVTYPQMQEAQSEPYYRINSPDGILVLAMTVVDEIILVKQFRPAIGRHTLEFPSGGVDTGETPEQAARRELREETGYDCARLESVGAGHIMVNRHNCLLHAFFAPRAIREDGLSRSEGLETILVSVAEFKRLVLADVFDQYPALALLLRIEWQLGIRLVR